MLAHRETVSHKPLTCCDVSIQITHSQNDKHGAASIQRLFPSIKLRLMQTWVHSLAKSVRSSLENISQSAPPPRDFHHPGRNQGTGQPPAGRTFLCVGPAALHFTSNESNQEAGKVGKITRVLWVPLQSKTPVNRKEKALWAKIKINKNGKRGI